MKQETTTKTTKAKSMEEIIEKLMAPETPEEKVASDLRRKKHFEEVYDQFLEQHDWLEKPSVQTKSAAAWTRENIVLDSWNQYINYEARMSEFFGEHPEGKGFRHLYNQRRCDVALGFAHYFLASMEAQVKMIDEDNE